MDVESIGNLSIVYGPHNVKLQWRYGISYTTPMSYRTDSSFTQHKIGVFEQEHSQPMLYIIAQDVNETIIYFTAMRYCYLQS